MEALPENKEASPVIVEFAMQGLIISVRHERMKRAEAIELFQRWFPDAEVIPDQLLEDEPTPHSEA